MSRTYILKAIIIIVCLFICGISIDILIRHISKIQNVNNIQSKQLAIEETERTQALQSIYSKLDILSDDLKKQSETIVKQVQTVDKKYDDLYIDLLNQISENAINSQSLQTQDGELITVLHTLKQEIVALRNIVEKQIEPLVVFNFDDLADATLYPVVRIFSPTGLFSGTGVVIGKQNLDDTTSHFFILTAAHLAKDNQNYEIQFYDFEGHVSKVTGVDILTKNDALDAAIMSFTAPIDSPIRIALTGDGDPPIFTPIFSVACHLGTHPLPIAGVVALPFVLNRSTNEVKKNAFTFISNSIYGASGGPVYNRKTFEVEGIISGIMVARVTSNGGLPISIDIPATYLCIAIKWYTIKQWLDNNQFSYVYEVE